MNLRPRAATLFLSLFAAPAGGAGAKLFQFFDFYGFVTCFCPKSGNKSPYFKKLEQVLP